nr:alpha/beta hydrolase [Lachnospiraceae bacterium]
MKRGRKILKIIVLIILLLILFLAVRAVMPARTPGIKGENSISEYRKVNINGADLQVMIRGTDKSNPVVIFVHGGPCCSEIPYVRKYQNDLEKEFTIVHYDQRGSGKSYKFGTDYSEVTAATHVEDLIALTEYVKE